MYVVDNLPFYTTIFAMFLSKVRILTSNLMSCLASVNSVKAAPILDDISSMDDLKTLAMVSEVSFQYHADMVSWIIACELALKSPDGQLTLTDIGFVPGDQTDYGSLLMHVVNTHQNILFLQGYVKSIVHQVNITNSSMTVQNTQYDTVFIDIVAISAKRVVSKLYHVIALQNYWLQKFTTRSIETTSKLSMWQSFTALFNEETSHAEHSHGKCEKILHSQQKQVTECIDVLRRIFAQITDQDCRILEQQAMQHVADSLDNCKGPVSTRVIPETEPGHPMRLTRRGKEQIKNGLRKSTNRDASVELDYENASIVYSFEIALLVRWTVVFGALMNKYWSPVILNQFESVTGVKLSRKWHEFKWHRVTRQFAATNNLAFMLLLLVVWILTDSLISAVFFRKVKEPVFTGQIK